MQLRARVLVVVLVFGGAAQAQPGEGPPPSEPVVDPPPESAPPPPPPPTQDVRAPAPPPEPMVTGYPTQLVARRLLLPVGSFEGGLNVVLNRTELGSDDSLSLLDGVPRVRYAAPGVELEAFAGISLFTSDLGDTTIERDRLSMLGAAVRHGLGADTSIGAELTVHYPVSDFPAYQPRAVVATKQHLSAASALQLSGFGGLDHQAQPSMSMVPDSNVMIVGGELRAQAQLDAQFGVEARAMLQLRHTLDGPDAPIENVLAQSYGVRAVAAVSPSMDVIAGFDVPDGQGRQKVFTLGFVARSVP